ncbi:hypothetical protein ACVIN2_002448 [Bradyrhizobium sp. USDA 3650]
MGWHLRSDPISSADRKRSLAWQNSTGCDRRDIGILWLIGRPSRRHLRGAIPIPKQGSRLALTFERIHLGIAIGSQPELSQERRKPIGRTFFCYARETFFGGPLGGFFCAACKLFGFRLRSVGIMPVTRNEIRRWFWPDYRGSRSGLLLHRHEAHLRYLLGQRDSTLHKSWQPVRFISGYSRNRSDERKQRIRLRGCIRPTAPNNNRTDCN